MKETDKKSASFSHLPVMLHECIDALNIKPDGVYVDCTAGGGGHSEGIAQQLTVGHLIAIDRDSEAIAAAGARLAPYDGRVTLIHDNFMNLSNILSDCKIEKVDGVLMDLGISSHQIDSTERGFSYMRDARLDMRMNPDDKLSAYEVVNEYSEAELKRVLYEYGEERFAPAISTSIIRTREKTPIETTAQLSELVCAVYPRRGQEGGHPAKRTFQAIRIEVNGELDVIAPAIYAACNALGDGGRLVVITFHSLEDRAVKGAFNKLAEGCTCPRDFPVCVCGNKPKLKIITKRPQLPSDEEAKENPRAKSAKLRVAERIINL